MVVAIGSDHAGYELKETIKAHLEKLNIRFEDYGTFSKERVDYPDIAVKVACTVANNEHEMGILICGTGIGMSIVANKIPGIRAALCTSEKLAEMSRRHNDANVLTLGGRLMDPNVARRIVKTFLETMPDEEERHKKRISKIHDLTRK